MQEKTQREHLKSIAPSGSRALLKKRGSKHFSEIAKDRWDKKKIKK